MRKCSICRQPATQGNAVNAWCSHEHAIQIIERNRAKQAKRQAKIERATSRKAKEAMKDHKVLTEEAKTAFNAFIRARDASQPCISCGRYEHELKHSTRGGLWDAGHYMSVGAHPELRFVEINVHRQCKYCNDRKGGNYAEYRKGLIARIGQEKVDWLEGPHEPLKLSRDDLRHIRDTYRKAARELIRRAA